MRRSSRQSILTVGNTHLLLLFVLFVSVIFIVGGCDSREQPVKHDGTPVVKSKPLLIYEEYAPPTSKNGGNGAIGITQSAYDFFTSLADETSGYGLYSYVIIPNSYAPERNAHFLKILFGTTIAATNIGVPRSQVNIMYLPVGQIAEARTLINDQSISLENRVERFLAEDNQYQYPIAQKLLSHFCGAHFEVCKGQLSKGPYLLTYPKRIIELTDNLERYLLVDLSKIHQQAFGEFINAFKAQVVRKDFTDRQKIDSMRLGILNLALNAADWLIPVREGIASIVHSSEDG